MTSYLRSYIESVADVPSELQRQFGLMRELDERAYRLQQQVDADMVQQLKVAAERQQEPVHSPTKRQKLAAVSAAAAAAAAGEKECGERIEGNMNELVKLSDEKLNIATQIYDYIDRHITKLDKDCKAFDAEIAKERQRLGMPPVEPTIGGGGGSVDTGKRKRKDGEQLQRKLTPEEQYQQALAMADPSEPKYCHCQRISFGEMIACENPDCPFEWFHFGCVSLTAENRPKGKWFCRDCRKALGKK